MPPTVGAAYGGKELELKGRNLTMGVWDTAGSERYESLTKHYYTGADAAIICFDLTEGKSWAKVKYWQQQVTMVESNCIICIVGNKRDAVEGRGAKPRGTPTSVISQFVTQVGAKYFETSAKTGEGIDEPFLAAASEWADKPQAPVSIYEPAVRLNNTNNGTKSGCC